MEAGNAAELVTAAVAIFGLLATALIVGHELSPGRRVAGWVEVGDLEPDVIYAEPPAYPWLVRVRNGSTAPIYMCTVTLHDPVPGSSSEDEGVYFGIVPPETTRDRLVRWNNGPVPSEVLAPSLAVTVRYDRPRRHWLPWRFPGWRDRSLEVDASGRTKRVSVPDSTC